MGDFNLKETIVSALEEISQEAVEGFLAWCDEPGNEGKPDIYIKDYQDFVASGRDWTTLTKDEIYDFLVMREGDSVAEIFRNYAEDKSMEDLYNIGKSYVEKYAEPYMEKFGL